MDLDSASNCRSVVLYAMPIDSWSSITPLLITYNEAPNIARVLACLDWATRVVVVDSGSEDGTVEICRAFTNVELVQRPFDNFAAQCNFGLARIDTEWCLSMDSDYIVPEETAREMSNRVAANNVDGCIAKMVYCIGGKPIRSGILTPRPVLFKSRLGHYEQDGHQHRLMLDGRVVMLKNPILHDDRKSFRRWLNAQDTYAGQEAQKLMQSRWVELNWADRARTLGVVAPWLVPAICLFAKGGIFDGWAGLDYAAQRAISELVLSIKLFERWEAERGQ